MDVYDRAQEIDHMFRMHALARQLQQSVAQKQATTAIHCVDCGEEIDEDRRRAVPGVERCVTCQGKHERRNKRYS